MPGKYGSPSVFFRVDGYNMLSAKLQSLRAKVESLTEKADGLGDTSESHDPTGIRQVELEQTGAFFDTSTNGGHAALAASIPTSPQATARVICLGFDTEAVGSHFIGLHGAFSAVYEVLGQLGNLTKANVNYVVRGVWDAGQVVQPLATKTGDWNTKTLGTTVDYTTDPAQRVVPITSNSQANPTVVTTTVPHGYTSGDIVLIAGVSGSSPDINGQQTVTVISTTTFSVVVNTSAGTGGTGGTVVRANSANGGAGYQQVTACSGFSGYIGKLRDSADDTTYADLVTFADVTAAPAAERVTVSGTVDRYLSHDGDVTGSGSITVFSGFARG